MARFTVNGPPFAAPEQPKFYVSCMQQGVVLSGLTRADADARAAIMNAEHEGGLVDVKMSQQELDNVAMRERLGAESSSDRLVIFLYLLLRDRMTFGDVERTLDDALDANEVHFTNGALARYCKDIRDRLSA